MSGEVRVETGAPGAVVSVEEIEGGVLVERNGVGSVLSYVYPNGLEDENAGETPAERVERLADELKTARKELKAASK